MSKNLVIVESPAKAKTIEGFLGKDFLVKSSFGHVRDLKTKGLAVDVENNFAPIYEITPDKKSVVSELKKLAKNAELVWLATDEDREGEAISWHLMEALSLNPEKVRRIAFHEITKNAVLGAIESPREIDTNLVNAQQARRVLDRLVGFELSPILWKKIKPSLSAGRVQSVAVRLIVEQERIIQEFKSTSSYRVTANFIVDGKTQMKAELSTRFKTPEEAEKFLNDCIGSEFSIDKLEKKPGKRSAAAPFTTSTLQQEAGRKLGFSVAQTMMVAQQLYESGKITYMRTDSVNLSDLAMNAAKDTIISSFGEKYSDPTTYRTKTKGAQEAHEAIRPTDLSAKEIEGDRNQLRLYELIWKRTIASQMSDAELEKTTATIGISGSKEKFQAQGEVLKFDGFLKVYMESTDDEEEDQSPAGKSILPPLSEGQKLGLEGIDATERFTHHPPRFTEASLVKKLEELGIGRPSTYAPTISTVQKRGYVEKESREGVEREYQVIRLVDGKVTAETKTERTGVEKNKLFPTDIGMVVTDFLVEHFQNVLDYNFTASVEQQFDDIAQGMNEWTKMIKSFYKPFHDNVEDTLEHSERASGERVLGEEPGTGRRLIVRIGRFGPIAQIGHADDEEKPKFASLLKTQSIGTITLEEALELFKLPRSLGEFESKEVTVAIGRFGPYVKHDNKFVSLDKKAGDDPMEIQLDRAIELIKAKREADANKLINDFGGDPAVTVLNGRYGPYIKVGRKNYRIPKKTEAASLTLEDCMKIIEESDKKPKAKSKKAAK